MTNKQQVYKKYLEEQLQWFSERDSILEEIEVKLYEMEKIAEYAREEELTSYEIERLNFQLNELKSEIQSLEKQLNGVVH
ncbi:hypothetical protein J18TS1_11710 [Oceanobacillus oncorhynchi subsp. incaldanensis]|uniref:hypothetical protein n=1 Tax=Oceanobacillus oncorhynchi TaxID=545501 RepID=UPI001AFF05D6|nr:hypothetical protein [Oceanobacillus oncorhynchi]GIO18071.1 hypothetical protein J18TS1_11710 [Oceanobacillus oncorhynchi subsp. incaldanensis]